MSPFVSAARLLPLDTNTLDDIYILERASGRLTLATAPYSSAASDGSALSPQLNAEWAASVAFNSLATVLTGAPDRNEADDVFVRRWRDRGHQPRERRPRPAGSQWPEFPPGDQRRRPMGRVRVDCDKPGSTRRRERHGL
jgi:hypothetical protein